MFTVVFLVSQHFSTIHNNFLPVSEKQKFETSIGKFIERYPECFYRGSKILTFFHRNFLLLLKQIFLLSQRIERCIYFESLYVFCPQFCN